MAFFKCVFLNDVLNVVIVCCIVVYYASLQLQRLHIFLEKDDKASKL